MNERTTNQKNQYIANCACLALPIITAGIWLKILTENDFWLGLASAVILLMLSPVGLKNLVSAIDSFHKIIVDMR